jgi:hypothetical protein
MEGWCVVCSDGILGNECIVFKGRVLNQVVTPYPNEPCMQ